MNANLVFKRCFRCRRRPRILRSPTKTRKRFGYFPALTAKFVFNSTLGRERNLKEEKASLKKHVEVLERALEEKTKQGI